MTSSGRDRRMLSFVMAGGLVIVAGYVVVMVCG